MGILIFKTDLKGNDNLSLPKKNEFSIKIWRPKIFSITPPLLSRKYFFWWLAHYLKIFRNKDYAAIVINDNRKTVGLIVLAPAYSRWKFMKKNDLQITNVHVSSEYREKGIAYHMIIHAFKNFAKDGRVFWYVTTDDNIPSKKLCEKAGFLFAGKGIKVNKTGIKGFHEIKLINEL